MQNDFDIISETVAGNYIILASSSSRQYAAIVAEALFAQYSPPQPPGVSQVRAVIVRDVADPRSPRLMDVWPAYYRDRGAWQAAVDRYQKQFEREGQRDEAPGL